MAAPSSYTPGWVMAISEGCTFVSGGERASVASSFYSLLKKFAPQKTGRLPKAREEERGKLAKPAFEAFKDFAGAEPAKPIDDIALGDLPPSFLGLVNFLNPSALPPAPAPMGSSPGGEAVTAKALGPPPAPEPTPGPQATPSREPSQPGHRCVFSPETISALAAMAIDPFGREQDPPALGTPPAPGLLATARPGAGAPNLEAGEQGLSPPKARSPKSKFTPKGQERLLVSLPVEIKRRLMAAAEAGGTTATKMIIKFIEGLEPKTGGG